MVVSDELEARLGFFSTLKVVCMGKISSISLLFDDFLLEPYVLSCWI